MITGYLAKVKSDGVDSWGSQQKLSCRLQTEQEFIASNEKNSITNKLSPRGDETICHH